MANGGFGVGSAEINIGVDLSSMTAALQRAEQITNSISKGIESSVNQGATGASASLSRLGNAAINTQTQVNRLDVTIQNQAQALKIAEAQLERTALRYGENSTAAARAQLSVDKLNRSLLLNGEMLVQAENKLRAYEATAGKTVQTTSQSGGIFSGVGGQIVGALGLAGGVATAVQQINQMSGEGQKLIATLDGERRTLGALLGDVDKGNIIFERAVSWGQKYNFTQAEMGDAAQSAALLIRNGNSSIEQTLDVLARLQAKNPDKSFGDAVRAVTELQAGQMQSLERIFNIPAAAVQNLSKEITAGQDPIKALDALLNQMGITDSVLQTRMEGATGAQNAYNLALEGFKIRLGELRQESGLQQAQTGLLQGLSGGLDLAMGKIGLDDLVKGFQQAQREGSTMGGVFGSLTTYFRGLAIAEQNAAQATTSHMDSLTKDDLAVKAAIPTVIDYKKALADVSTQLSASKANLSSFTSAVLPGTRAFEDAQSQLALASEKADLALLDFQEAGGGLSKVLDPIQHQIDATKASTADWKDKLDQATAAVDAQSRVLADAEQAQQGYNDAVKSAQDNLGQQQDRLSALQDSYNNLGDAIKSAQHDMESLRHTALVGEGALSDQLFAMEEGIKRQQLRIDQMRLGGASKKDIEKAQKELERLRTEEEAAQLRGDLRYDKAHRDLLNQGVPRDEKTFEQASHDIGQYQKGVEQLTQAQEAAGQAVEDQKAKIRDAQFDVMDASAVQRDHAAAVREDKDQLDKLKLSQDDIRKSYELSKQQLETLNKTYQDAKDQAILPYKNAVDLAKDAEHRLQIQHDLTTGALQHTLDEIKKNQKEMPYDQIVTGIQSWQHEIDILTAKYNDLQTAEKRATDPNAAAAGSNAFPGMQAPFTGQTGGTSDYSAQAIDAVLAKEHSPLTGQGQFIIEMSQKYGIPVEVALAMWKVEGDYGTLGASVANKNPGNLRKSNFAAGTTPDNFALFDSWKAGIEGFFDLLRHNSYGYDTDVDKYKQSGDTKSLLHLISTYAPVGDGNNNPQEYYNSVIAMIAQLLKAIGGGGATAAQSGTAGVINDGTMADDPRPNQYGIDSVVPGAHLGDTYDADRGALGVHAGLDLQITNGTPVHVPLALTNIVTGYYADAARKGYYVTGIDQYGREWYFGHMTSLNVKDGDSIGKGGTIGTVGMGHVHVQLKQHRGDITPIDPSAALDSAAASGAGPGVGADPYRGQSAGAGTMYQPQRYSIGGPRYGTPIATGLDSVNGAIAGLLPNLDDLIKAVEGVGTAAADTTAGMVNATDDILDHATYKNRSGELAYLNQNGGLSGDKAGWTRKGGDGMSVGGPHFGAPIATPPESMKGNDPTMATIASVGAAVAGLPDITAQSFDGIAKLTPGWKDTWQAFGDASVAEIDRAQQFMFGAEQNILQYVTSAEQRIDDLIGKILSIPGIHVSTGPSQHDPGGVNDPGQPGGTPAAPPTNTGNRYQYNTIITRDSDRAMRLLRQQGS